MQGIGLSTDHHSYTKLSCCYTEEAGVIDFINNMDYVIGPQDMIVWNNLESLKVILFKGVEICGDGA